MGGLLRPSPSAVPRRLLLSFQASLRACRLRSWLRKERPNSSKVRVHLVAQYGGALKICRGRRPSRALGRMGCLLVLLSITPYVDSTNVWVSHSHLQRLLEGST